MTDGTGASMLSHITIGISDFGRALTFYDGLFAILGLVRKFAAPDPGWAGWMAPDQPRPLVIITLPHDGAPHLPGNGQMTAFLARDRALVARAHAFALAHGGIDEGAPGLRPQYHPDYYGAYFRDPDGNKLCVCCHAAG